MGSTGPAPSRQHHQQHPRVKRERNISNEIIDLADPTRESIRVKENLAPDEELLCDLTGDEDATPRWKKRQKPAIEIDETQINE